MTVAVEDRVPIFRQAAGRIISKYNLRQERSPKYINALRVGCLFSNEIVKIYSAKIGQDALICFRDWAYKNDIVCDPIIEMEKSKHENPFFNPSVRLYDRLSFKIYTDILEELLFNHRQPLTGRDPLVSEV